MGTISRKLLKRFHKQKQRTLLGRWRSSSASFQIPDDVRNPADLVKKGYDPLHAAYVSAQNLTSAFAEQLSVFRELDEYCGIAGKAEEEHMPSGPPMSPLTSSYFTTWAFFDLAFGPDKETIGTCVLELADLFDMDSLMQETVRHFQESRMGIYEVVGASGGKTVLNELLTDRQRPCLIPTGYKTRPGELLYLRLCPPLPDLGGYHVAFTTPYVLRDFSAEDWTAYLRRAMLSVYGHTTEADLHAFLKYGPKPNFWNEYIFLAYKNYQNDAVFLTGLPDVKGSLPHADSDEEEWMKL